MAPELRKRNKPQTAAPEKPAAAAVKKTKVTTKRQAIEEASPVSVKKQKTVTEVKPKKAAAEAKPARAVVKETKKKVTKPKAQEEVVEEVEEVVAEEAEDSVIPLEDASGSDGENEDDDEIDAEIQALAAGLDPEDDDGRTGDAAVYKAGEDVGKIPSNKLTKQEKKALAARKSKEEPGVIYVGRLPHGFYEHELRGYFGQFGRVTRLRLSRNKKTGKSKHYAFIEFSDESTAQIAAKTMDKYLLFGHILTVKFVEKESLHADVWKGANRRFKQTPWAKIAGNKLARPVSESAWAERIDKEQQRRANRAEKLKELGYDFDAPALKSAPAPLPIEAAEQPKAIEAAAEEDKTTTNGAPDAVEVEVEAVEEVVEPVKAKKGKAKKAKKAKA